MKKPVHSSHLALRFYKGDGWTKEILDKYLIRGRVCDQWADQEVRDYWFLDHTQGSALDMERLLAEEVSKVHRWYGERRDEPGYRESDLDFMNHMNW